MREINQAGLDLLKKFEGRRLVSYQDQVGVWTIGYGHTGPDVVPGMTISPDEAEALLKQDLEKFYHLDEYLSEQVNDNQYSALVVLAYNIGLRALKLSSIIRKINAGERPDVEWMQYVHGKVNGVEVVLHGLVARRDAELKLFNTLG